MAKEGETLFFCLPTCLFFSSTCQLVIRQLVTRQQYPMRLELCKKIHIILLVVIKLLTLRIY